MPYWELRAILVEEQSSYDGTRTAYHMQGTVMVEVEVVDCDRDSHNWKSSMLKKQHRTIDEMKVIRV